MQSGYLRDFKVRAVAQHGRVVGFGGASARRMLAVGRHQRSARQTEDEAS